MTIYLNMLSHFMKHWIWSNVQGCFTITKQQSFPFVFNTNVLKKVQYPHNFTSSHCHCSILCLCRRSRDCWLSLGLPWDQRITNENTITCDRPPGVKTSSLVRVCEAFYMQFCASWKQKTLAWFILQIL